MSFRNSAVYEHQNIKIQQQGPSQLFLETNLSANFSSLSPTKHVLTKIAGIIATLHENYLLKCQNIEIYRDLSSQQQQLLVQAGKDTVLHTVLAGALAIDSCFKSLQRQQQFVIGNLVRANAGLISSVKKLQKELINSNKRQLLEPIADSIKFVTQQLQSLPEAKGREAELQRQIAILEGKGEDQGDQWLKGENTVLMSELQRQNDMLKLAIKQKDGYIQSLQGAMDRGSRFQKKQERKTSHSLGLRMMTQKSSENESESQASLQQVYEELARVRQQLFQKNNIIVKMNQQFASEVEKYNSVFKRLEEQNRILKKYSDVDTAYLLQELEIEVQSLKQQRYKDQMIISDIQRKFQGFSFSRNSRINTELRQANYPEFNSYDPLYNQKSNYHIQQLLPQRQPQLYERPQQRYPQKFYSPNYAPSRSPYQRHPPSTLREESYFPQQTLRTKTRRDQFRNKSRTRFQGLHSSRERQILEPKSTQSINLLERVMAKGL